MRTWLHKKQDIVRDLRREKSGPVLISDYWRILWLGLDEWQAQDYMKLLKWLANQQHDAESEELHQFRVNYEDLSCQEVCLLHSESEDSKLYKVKRLRTKRPVAKVEYRSYKYELIQYLFKEWESKYQVRKRKQIILTVEFTCVSERLSVSSLSHMQRQKKIMLDSAII